MKYKLSKAFGKSLERLGGKELRSVLAVLDEVERVSSIYEFPIARNSPIITTSTASALAAAVHFSHFTLS